MRLLTLFKRKTLTYSKNYRCASKSPRCSKALTLSGPLFVNRKKIARGRKNDLFRNFLCYGTSTHRNETFLFLSNFHIFSRSEKSWGGQTNVNFRLKMPPQAKKITFFGFFFFCCTSSRRDETFLLLPKIHIFSRLEKSWGDQKKRYINDNDERTTTNERRTTNYIDDHNTPSGFSESSG